MTFSLRSFAAGLGLLGALALSSSAFAGPKIPSLNPSKGPTVKPTIPLSNGLTSKATLTPRSIYTHGASMDIHRGVRLEGSANRLKMDKHTQLWIHFKAAQGKKYDVDCNFSGSASVLVMDYANNKFVRQKSTAISGGRLHHRVFARSRSEPIKVYMQANRNVDWTKCTVTPG